MTIANSIVLGDNCYGTIASGLAVGDTALAFTTGHGARFPTVATGQVLYCCILNANNVLEEVQITAHAAGSDSATMVRAVNGTTAKAWTAGDLIQARISSAVLKTLQIEAMKTITLSTADAGATYTGAMSITGLGYVTGMVYPLSASTTNAAAPTINLDSIGTVTVKLNGGTALTGGEMPVNGLYQYDGTNFILLNPQPVIGTFTATLTGCTTAPTYTIKYTKIGNTVTFRLVGGLWTGTSNTTAKTLTGMPAALWPSETIHLLSETADNGGAFVVSVLFITTAGVITFTTNPTGAAWTAAGVASGYTNSQTYTLA